MVIIRRNDLFRPKKNRATRPADETDQRVENVATESEKVKTSTQTREEPADSAEIAGRTAKTATTAEPHVFSVDDSNKFKSRETEKNRISARLIDRDVVESEDGRKVIIEVYDTGQVEEKVTGDKVISVRKIKFALRYKNTIKECIDDCRDAVKDIAKITRSHPPAKEIMTKINELKEEYATPEEISIVDYVRQKYPDRLNEIEKDPFGWILQRTKEIVGYERLKLLTFLSIVSSQMERVMGISRIHIMLVGKSGAGKSTTIKSVTRYIDGTDMYIPGTRLTQNSLGYVSIDSFDGKVLFIDQIDRQNINYIREMMTEEKVCTLVTEKVVDDNGNERFESHQRCIPGQPAVITTSVADDIDVDREQIFNRFLKVYANPESLDVDKVIEAIWTRKKSEISEVDRLVFMAYLLSRPKFADNSDLLDRAKKFIQPIMGVTSEPVNRTIEVLRNLVIVTAIARGKTKADDDDFNFVMQNFQLDILYNGLGLTERDVEIIEALPDNDGKKSQEVADELKVSKQYAINVLKNLERKGVVEGEKEDGKTFTWYLTPLGRRIKALVNNIDKDVVEVRDEKGELTGVADAKFRDDANAGNDRTNAMPRNGANRMSGVDEKDDRVIEAYKFLKKRGWTLVTELTFWYGDDVIEKLKRKDLVTFNTINGVEYVNAK
jgi:predicted transcriptional regulator